MPKTWGWEESPCRSCHRRENPDKCKSKSCWYWYDWFVRSWNNVREILIAYDKEVDENG